MTETAAAPTAVRFVTARKVNYRVTGTVDALKRKVAIVAHREEINYRTDAAEWRGMYGKMPACLADAIAEINTELTPMIPAAPVDTREPNAGMCMICGAPYKIDRAGNLVLHGYQRPGHGWIEGRCWSVGLKPWEKSNEQMVRYRPAVVNAERTARAYLARLQSGEVDSFPITVSDMTKPYDMRTYSRPQINIVVRRGDEAKQAHRDGYDAPSYARKLQIEISNTEREVEMAVRELARVDDLLAGWAETPLTIRK